MSNRSIKINRDDLPSFYKLASDTSKKGQKWYTASIFINLLMLASSSLFVAVIVNPQTLVLYSIMLAVSILASLYAQFGNSDRNWYEGRAMAESIKSLTWRYIMKATPYNRINSEKRFTSDLRNLIKQKKLFAGSLSGESLRQPLITLKMNEARTLPLKGRKELYINYRLEDQRNWYATKSDQNRTYSLFLTIGVVVAQLIAWTIAAYALFMQLDYINALGFFITIGAVLIGWSQMKQNKTLAESYSIACQELNIIIQDANSISSVDKFSQFVVDAEKAISREHTLWLARKNTI